MRGFRISFTSDIPCPKRLKERIALVRWWGLARVQSISTILLMGAGTLYAYAVNVQPKIKRPSPRNVLPFQKRIGSLRSNSRARALSSRAHLSSMEFRNFAQALG